MTYVRRKAPLDGLQSEWTSLYDELDRAHNAEREAHTLGSQIQAENGLLTEQIDRVTTELNYWRAYALELETRLDVVISVISDTKTRARDRARDEVAKQTETIPFAPDPNLRAMIRATQAEDDDGAAGVAAALAPPQYQ
jgi:predicted nuclease with TOPRIM domain